MDDKLTLADIKDKTLQSLLFEFMEANANEDFESEYGCSADKLKEVRKRLRDIKHALVEHINNLTSLQGFK